MPNPTPFTQLNPQDEFQQRALARFQGEPPAPTFQDLTGSGEQPTGAMASLAQPAMPVPGAVPEPFFDPNKLEIDPAPAIPLNADTLGAMAQGKQMANALTGEPAGTELLPATAENPGTATTENLPAKEGKTPAAVEPLGVGAGNPLTPGANGMAAADLYGQAEANSQQSDKLVKDALVKDTQHWDSETQQMVEGGNNEPDDAEIAAHVAGIHDDWKAAEAKIMASTAEKLKANLEKLRANQERIQLGYQQAVDDVARTYINPSELWDKGGMGAQIGLPAASFLDTFFAMKGFNVPSFSAPWDKQIENNITAQRSKLDAKNAKVAGFAKLWDMAGQLASTEEQQIGITKDLMKANLLGQYIAQMKPFDSIQASKDQHLLAAKALRELAETQQKRAQDFANNAAKARDQELRERQIEAEIALKQATLNAKKGAASLGSGVGASRAIASTGDQRATHDYLMKQDGLRFSEQDGVRHADAFGAMPNYRQNEVLNHLIGDDKKTDYRIFYTIDENGNTPAAGAYDVSAIKGAVQTDEIKALQDLRDKAGFITQVNNAMADVMMEAKQNGEDLNEISLMGGAAKWWNQKLNNPGKELTAKQRALDVLLRSKSLAELHELSGGAVTQDEGIRFERFIPTGAFDAAGRLRTGVSSAMAGIAKRAQEKANIVGQATGSAYKLGQNPAIDKLLSKAKDRPIYAGGIERQAAIAGANDADPEATKEGSLEPNSSYVKPYFWSAVPFVNRDELPAHEVAPFSMGKLRKPAIDYFNGKNVDPDTVTKIKNYGETIVAMIRLQDEIGEGGDMSGMARGAARDILHVANNLKNDDDDETAWAPDVGTRALSMHRAAKTLQDAAKTLDAMSKSPARKADPEVYRKKLDLELAKVKAAIEASLNFDPKPAPEVKTPKEVNAAYEKVNADNKLDVNNPAWWQGK